MKLLACMLLTAAALAASEPARAVVMKPVVNMFSRASEDAEVASQTLYGASVTILEAQDGWSRIRTADDYTGWVAPGTVRAGLDYPGANAVEVTSLFAHVYREPSVTKHAPVVTLPFESRLAVTAKHDDRWLAIQLADGRAAFVQTGDVAANPPRMTIPQMLEFARRFMGLPYTWGGTSSYGYDCSGFAQMLSRRRGYQLPRDAQPQAEWSGMQKVERAELAPGDLLYFGSSEKKITHTGVYIGDGKFINATTHITPMIRIDDLNDAYWSKLLVAARRIKP